MKKLVYPLIFTETSYSQRKKREELADWTLSKWIWG